MTEPGPSPAESAPQAPAPAPAPTPEAPDYRDLFLRATAELENYRKRTERDRQALIQFAAEGLARKLLDPVDSFDRAIRDLECLQGQAPDALKATLAVSLEGLRALKRQFLDALAGEGVEPFRPEGAPFDPAFHEGLVRVPHPSLPEGTVVEVLQPGYTLRGRVLRPARVAVSSGLAPSETPKGPAPSGAPDNSHRKASGR